MWENEAAAVRMGLRILIRCRDQSRAQIWLREMVNLRDMEPRPQNNMIVCASGGFAHFVWSDNQVRGYEYHEALGPMVKVLGLTDEMRSRVRLDATR